MLLNVLWKDLPGYKCVDKCPQNEKSNFPSVVSLKASDFRVQGLLFPKKTSESLHFSLIWSQQILLLYSLFFFQPCYCTKKEIKGMCTILSTLMLQQLLDPTLATITAWLVLGIWYYRYLSSWSTQWLKDAGMWDVPWLHNYTQPLYCHHRV